jgi:hypothetical protein
MAMIPGELKHVTMGVLVMRHMHVPYLPIRSNCHSSDHLMLTSIQYVTILPWASFPTLVW